MNGRPLAPAIFLDRDGVITRNRDDYVKSWEELELLPGAVDGLRRLSALRWPIVIVTNQSAVGRGLVSLETLHSIHRRMLAALEEAGCAVRSVRYCPHRPDEACGCRKPLPGMLLDAAEELVLSLPHSYFIGDAVSDVEAARAAGCRPVLVRSGRGAAELERVGIEALRGVRVTDDLAAAAALILQLEAGRGE